MTHIVLLGDSIFDNGNYVSPGQDVTAQLRRWLGQRAEVTNLAVDGFSSADIVRQLHQVPDNASHLIVSCGGNDALGSSQVLEEPVGTVAAALGRLAEVQGWFADDYAQMLEGVLDLGIPTTLCTIYDANYNEPARTVVRAALSLFNDVILRAALSEGQPVIDLRLICTQPEDYANAIEPSVQGGEKIARAIADQVLGSETC